jgi:hypothetical protein
LIADKLLLAGLVSKKHVVWSTVITLARLISSSLAASNFSKRGVYAKKRSKKFIRAGLAVSSVNRFHVVRAEVGEMDSTDNRTSPQ